MTQETRYQISLKFSVLYIEWTKFYFSLVWWTGSLGIKDGRSAYGEKEWIFCIWTQNMNGFLILSLFNETTVSTKSLIHLLLHSSTIKVIKVLQSIENSHHGSLRALPYILSLIRRRSGALATLLCYSG